MEENRQHFRHIMLFYYRKGKSAAKTQRKICAVYGENAVNSRTCQKWFAKFRSGDFSLEDTSRVGRPVEIDTDEIKTLIRSNQRYTTREIADIVNVSKSSVKNHLRQLGYIYCLGSWVLQKSSKNRIVYDAKDYETIGVDEHESD